ncbi:hypothetical protein M8C21_006758 [Ambrosia artemisiifolia]|uniref:Aminotransferase class I/classII large domain-containing protein n=1 Tax=Ambrosia artemisiifolia TaxID=4212 RepID=A0AAD5DB54_AMBAR|nr:hypothetical protein M8C21_006758 [Ambrosia artemisiifolia]
MASGLVSCTSSPSTQPPFSTTIRVNCKRNMEEKLSSIAKTLKPSSIQQLFFLAAERSNAVDLAVGFPDFPAPQHIKAAAVSAITSDINQYSYNMMSIINPGDEVILFDPCFEIYETCILMAGGVPVYVALDPPYWTLDETKLSDAFTSNTKALVLNSPHNPTGKVFDMDELRLIADYCRTKDCIAITDEVYEHIIYDNEPHISLSSLPGMQKRTIITSSLSKTYSVTGWRIGWAIGPSCVAFAIKNIHTKLTDCAPAPFQEAALTALRSPPEYYRSLRKVDT